MSFGTRRIKPQIHGGKRSTWRHLPSHTHCIPHISARLLHSGIFCCWKGSAFTRGRLRDSAAWELPHLHNQPQFPLQTGFSSMLHICDHHQLLGHSWRQQIHLSFNSAKLILWLFKRPTLQRAALINPLPSTQCCGVPLKQSRT